MIYLYLAIYFGMMVFNFIICAIFPSLRFWESPQSFRDCTEDISMLVGISIFWPVVALGLTLFTLFLGAWETFRFFTMLIWRE